MPTKAGRSGVAIASASGVASRAKTDVTAVGRQVRLAPIAMLVLTGGRALTLGGRLPALVAAARALVAANGREVCAALNSRLTFIVCRAVAPVFAASAEGLALGRASAIGVASQAIHSRPALPGGLRGAETTGLRPVAVSCGLATIDVVGRADGPEVNGRGGHETPTGVFARGPSRRGGGKVSSRPAKATGP